MRARAEVPGLTAIYLLTMRTSVYLGRHVDT